MALASLGGVLAALISALALRKGQARRDEAGTSR